MPTMLAHMKLSDTAKKCIDHLKELIMEENHQENERLCSYDLYATYCKQLEKAIPNDTETALWRTYRNMQKEEADFFDPHEAYLAGREAKLDGEMDKNISYKFYISDIKNSERYRQFKKNQEFIFTDLLHALETEYHRERLFKIDQLYKRLYAPFEKNLWIFFNLGYDCCQA